MIKKDEDDKDGNNKEEKNGSHGVDGKEKDIGQQTRNQQEKWDSNLIPLSYETLAKLCEEIG